ncbi:hypothetical protein [Metamycoplasma hominis]
MEYLQNIDLSKIRSLCLQKKREFIFNYCLFEQLKDKQLKQKKSQTINDEEDDDISKLEKFIKLLNSDNQKIFLIILFITILNLNDIWHIDQRMHITKNLII